MQRNNNSIMIFEIMRGGKTDWVGKEWAGLFFPRGKNGPAHSFPGEKTDWGEILACYTGNMRKYHQIDIYIYQCDIVIASVCLLCYLLNHWAESNQIWCVSYLHEWGLQQQLKIWPCPLGPWGGVKRSNIIKISITKSISKIFIPNFLFVLEMKDIKHIEQDFCGTWGRRVLRGSKNVFSNMVMWG